MDYRGLLDETASERQLVHVEHIPARHAEFAEPERPLPAALMETLGRRGIDRLWSHQAAALDHLRAGRHVAISTGTASGKSLCYQLASLEALLEDPAARALYVFPTKALARDQLRSVRGYVLPGVASAAYDGDTPPDERLWVRRHARLVVTNPDMLHFGVLPSHAQWSSFLAGLRFVVVDEMHTLRGVWGAHVALILRRLRRLCERYGSEPVFCCSSATVGDPGGLAERLCGVPMEVVTEDASPSGERKFALWNPPLASDDGSRRRSSHVETATLLSS
ncbi:MAG: DEAD/DEAH box helicase, partial [Chloroflexota bacterium]|nr:DEAD/DEAH box helicase [Chloroflexota bacterium]